MTADYTIIMQMIIFKYVWVPEEGTADTPNLPIVLTPLKEIWGSPQVPILYIYTITMSRAFKVTGNIMSSSRVI